MILVLRIPFFARFLFSERILLGSVCRRVYRIFSHAYYHHRDLFDEFEVMPSFDAVHFIAVGLLQNETHLCKRFTVFVTKYNLMSREHLIVPILEGMEEQTLTESTA